jgi:hypothetical protein
LENWRGCSDKKVERVCAGHGVSVSLPRENMSLKERDLEAERKEHVSVHPSPPETMR